MSSRLSRPALLPLDHPLSYSTSKPRSKAPGIESRVVNTSEDDGNEKKDFTSMLQKILDRQDIVNLLNDYAYILDTVMVNREAAKDWAALFTLDCSVTYPFGHFSGRSCLQICAWMQKHDLSE